VGDYDPTTTLVIDPSLAYSTFIGGSGDDRGYAITVDSSGNAYLTGSTQDGTTDYPTTSGAYDTSHNGNYDVFVTKLNSEGGDLVYSTYIGMSSGDSGCDIAVDSSGNAYVTGYTSSSSYPTTDGAYDTSHNGGYDVFVTKLNSAGSALAYSTFIGGSGEDRGYGIALDSSGNAYLIGYTEDSTTDYPTTSGAYDTTHNGNRDVFVTKLNSAGSALAYSTFIGGSDDDRGYGIALDSSGNAYLTGYTEDSTTDYPTTGGAYDTSHNGNFDVFVTKLNSAGSALSYSTFLGGSGSDYGYGIVVDSSGNAYVTGYAQSGFPTTSGAYDESNNGGYDVFVTKLNSGGSSLVYSTFIGGSGSDYGYGIALDSSGNTYVTGYTQDSTTDYPTTSGAYDTSHNGGYDVFVTKLVIWTSLGADTYDASTNAVDIKNTGNDALLFFMDSNYMYFQFYTEAAPAVSSYTYAVLLDDGGEGTYDYAIASYGQTSSVSLYKWDATNKWDNANVLIRDVEDFNFDTTNNVVQFAVAFVDTFTLAAADKAYAATYDTESNAFEDGGGDWESTNVPTPSGASEGDYTTAAVIPEFPALALPVVWLVALFLVARRKRERLEKRSSLKE